MTLRCAVTTVSLKRHLFNLVAFLSLLLFAAVVALWLRGHFIGDEWHLPPSEVTDVTPAAPTLGPAQTWRRQVSFHAGGGRVRVMRREVQEGRTTPAGHTTTPPRDAVGDLPAMTASDRAHSALGFAYLRRDKQPFNRPPVTGWYWGFVAVTVPCWALAAVTAVLPTLWALRRVSQRRNTARANRGLCPACGYDLRATPDHCPECGQRSP